MLPLSVMDMVTTNLQQQRQITEQLRREAALKRITVSKAVEDIMKYITEHEQEDYLLIFEEMKLDKSQLLESLDLLYLE